MGIVISLIPPGMEMFHDQNRVSILDIVEVVGLGPGDFPDDGHHGPSLNGRRIEKLLLDRKEAPV